MGRKIPGKKHRGVKDPIKQQSDRLAGLKKKINAPPTNPDDQPVPKSVQSLILYKEKLKNAPVGLKKNKNKKKKRLHDNDNRDRKELKNMKKNPGESSRSFLLRVNHAVKSISHSQSQMEEYKMGIDSDDETDGNSKKWNSKKRNNEFVTSNKKSNKKLGLDGKPKLSRAKQWTLRKQMKQEKKMEESESNYAPKFDHVRFGEVVHEPPTFTVKPRKAQILDGAPRPGRKELLLNKLLAPLNSSIETTQENNTNILVNTSGKRKDLPSSVRQRLEQSQQEAIQAYRALKKSK